MCGVAVVCVPCFLVGGGWVPMSFGSFSCSVWCVRGARRWPGTVFLWSRGVLKHGVFAGARKQNKQQKKKEGKEEKNVKVLGPGGRTSAKTLLKRGVLKVKKRRHRKRRKKQKKTPRSYPLQRGGKKTPGGQRPRKHMPKRGVLKMKKKRQKRKPPLKNFNIKSDFLT